MKLANSALDEAWRALSARVLETIVDFSVREIDTRTARVTMTLSSGAVICEDVDLWTAAAAQGFGLSTVSCLAQGRVPTDPSTANLLPMQFVVLASLRGVAVWPDRGPARVHGGYASVKEG